MDLTSEFAKYGALVLALAVGVGALWKAYQGVLLKLFDLTVAGNRSMDAGNAAINANTQALKELRDLIEGRK